MSSARGRHAPVRAQTGTCRSPTAHSPPCWDIALGTLDGFVLFKPCHSFPGSSSEDREYRAFTARVSRADKRSPDVGVVFFVCLF